MTISSEINRKDYAGNGSAVDFATGFRFLENDQLKVILTVDSTGVETVKALNTDYSVSGSDDNEGGTVSMNSPPLLGETLTIKRDMEILQERKYVEGDNFPAESHERALDKLTMLIQQLQEEVSRSIKLSEGQQSSGLSIPSPVESKFLQWDAEGNLINVDISSLGAVAISDYGKGLVVTLNDSDAREYIADSAAIENNIVSFSDTGSTKDSGTPIKRYGNAAGTVDAMTVSFDNPVVSLVDKMEFQVRSVGQNTIAAPTINIDGLGVVTIVKNGNQPLSANDTGNAGNEMILSYTTSNGGKIELLNPLSTSVLSVNNLYHIQDQQPSGTAGGTQTAGSWAARVVNTELVANISGANLSAGVITLPAGNYYTEYSYQCYNVGRSACRLQDTTGAATLLSGHAMLTASSNTETGGLNGYFALSVESDIEYQERSSTTQTSDGRGVPAGLSFAVANENYADVRIWKVS